jgi:hypothetical protein
MAVGGRPLGSIWAVYLLAPNTATARAIAGRLLGMADQNKQIRSE